MQLPVVRVRSPSVVAKAASNSRTLKQKPLHHKAARAPDLPLMQITGGASCDTYTRAFECAEGVLGQALTEPSLERSDWREVLTEFNFMKGKHLDLSTTTLGFVTRQAERPAMLAYSGAGVVLYTFDDATDGHMCLLLLEEVGVGSHRPSRHRWRDSHFKNGNQLTLSLPGGKREPMDPTPEATAQRELREESAGLISPEILRGGIEDMIYVGLGNFAFFPCQIASMEDIPAQYWGGHVGRSTDTHAHWVPVRDLPMRPISAFLEHALQKCPLLPWLYLRQVKHDREVQQARVQQIVHQVSAKRKAAAGKGPPPPATSSDPSWDSTISAMKASHGPQKGPPAGRSKGRAASAKMVTAAAVDGWHRRRQHLQYTLLRARQRSSGEKLLGIEQLYSSDLPPAAGDGGNSSQGRPGKPAASDDDALSRGQPSGSEGPSVQATGRAACVAAPGRAGSSSQEAAGRSAAFSNGRKSSPGGGTPLPAEPPASSGKASSTSPEASRRQDAAPAGADHRGGRQSTLGGWVMPEAPPVAFRLGDGSSVESPSRQGAAGAAHHDGGKSSLGRWAMLAQAERRSPTAGDTRSSKQQQPGEAGGWLANTTPASQHKRAKISQQPAVTLAAESASSRNNTNKPAPQSSLESSPGTVVSLRTGRTEGQDIRRGSQRVARHLASMDFFSIDEPDPSVFEVATAHRSVAEPAAPKRSLAKAELSKRSQAKSALHKQAIEGKQQSSADAGPVKPTTSKRRRGRSHHATPTDLNNHSGRTIKASHSP